MLKLLLSADRHTIRREYKFRLFNVFLIFSFLTMMVIGILFFPAHIHLSIEKKNIEQQVVDLENSDIIKQKAELDLLNKEIEEKYVLFKDFLMNPTRLITSIISNQPPGISIESFSLTHTEDKIDIKLQGLAKDRETLILFSDRLKKEKVFSKVELPFSSLTKNNEIPFTFSIESQIYQEKI